MISDRIAKWSASRTSFPSSLPAHELLGPRRSGRAGGRSRPIPLYFFSSPVSSQSTDLPNSRLMASVLM